MIFTKKPVKIDTRPTNVYDPIESTISNHISAYPTPSNLTYSWSFGSLVGLFFALQLLTGILLAMHYTPHVDLAFASVAHIMQDVTGGYLFRYFHANGASAVFILLYLHIARNLYYQSYLTRPLLWQSGLLIFLLMMATAFIGYVLPWGQMSFWGATVITSLVTAVPFVGQDIAYWVWGGFSINNATLTRFFSLHYLLPFLITGLIFAHLILLHTDGSSDPLTLQTTPDKLVFHPYFTYKDAFIFTMTLGGFAVLVAYFPNMLGHSDNFLPANPLVTPAHIVPEWYFTPFYAILRSCPNKLGGAIGMFAALILLFFLPYYIDRRVATLHVYAPYANAHKVCFWLFIAVFLTLMFLGSRAAAAPYVVASQVFTVLYFLYFLAVIPVLGILADELLPDLEEKEETSRASSSEPRAYANGVTMIVTRGNFQWMRLVRVGDLLLSKFFDDAPTRDEYLMNNIYRFIAIYLATRVFRHFVRWGVYWYILYKTWDYWAVPPAQLLLLKPNYWLTPEWYIPLAGITAWAVIQSARSSTWAATDHDWARYSSYLLGLHGSEERIADQLPLKLEFPPMHRPAVLDMSTVKFRHWTMFPQFSWEHPLIETWIHHHSVSQHTLRLLQDWVRNHPLFCALFGRTVTTPLRGAWYFERFPSRSGKNMDQLGESLLVHSEFCTHDYFSFSSGDYFSLNPFWQFDIDMDVQMLNTEFDVPIQYEDSDFEDEPNDPDFFLHEQAYMRWKERADVRLKTLKTLRRRGVPYKKAWYMTEDKHRMIITRRMSLYGFVLGAIQPTMLDRMDVGYPVTYRFLAWDAKYGAFFKDRQQRRDQRRRDKAEREAQKIIAARQAREKKFRANRYTYALYNHWKKVTDKYF